ncbi:hypothetical protein OAS86_05485 [Gammaproteobacteria bacterium]|nr:hypothetical protein [Gammaproteobacteria bacterium]
MQTTPQIKDIDADNLSDTQRSDYDPFEDRGSEYGLSSCLRLTGAVTIVAAVSHFLMAGWNADNDTERLVMLLAQLVLIAASGLGLSRVLNDQAGARVFVGLSTVLSTAIFAALGAMVYSAIPLDGQLATSRIGDYQFAQWQVSGIAVLAASTIGSFIIIAPLALFAYSVLSRPNARWMSALFLTGNMLLWVPLRDSTWALLAAAAYAFLGWWVVQQRFNHDPTLRTPAGMTALFSLLAPLVVLVVRSVFFYGVDNLDLWMFSLVCYYLLRRIEWGSTLVTVSTLFTIAAIVTIGAGLVHDYIQPLNGGQLAAVPLLTSLVLGADWLSKIRDKVAVYGMAVMVSWFIAVLYWLSGDEWLVTALLVVAGLAVLVFAHRYRYLPLFVPAAIALALAAKNILWLNLLSVDWSNSMLWVGAGALAIIVAALIERQGSDICSRLKHHWHLR